MKYPTHPDTVSVEDTGAPRHIGLFLFDGVEELDGVGPWEVLGTGHATIPRTAGPSHACR